MHNRDIVSTIQKLLKLSGSSNIHEAGTAATKAQELLSKYNLTLNDVKLNTETGKAERVSQKTRQQLEKWAFGLAYAASTAFDCEYFHNAATGKTIFVGVGADPEICSWMFGYLYRTLLRLATDYMHSSCSRLRLNKSKKEARNSFLLGAVQEIQNRLEAQKRATPITSGALQPFKMAAIRAEMPRDLKETKLSTGKLRDKDWQEGLLAGRNIALSTPLKHNDNSRKHYLI